MKKALQTLALSVLLFAPASASSAQVSIGIRIGEPPPPRVYRSPYAPAPSLCGSKATGIHRADNTRGTTATGRGRRTRARTWVEPYHVGGQYYAGRWEGSRAPLLHDHRWDREKRRDERREPRRRDNDRR